MGERFYDVAGAAVRVRKSESTIRRWIGAGELAQVLGRVRESELLEVEQRMRARRGGRPPKPDAPAPDPVAVVAEALGSDEHGEVVVEALREAGILPAENRENCSSKK